MCRKETSAPSGTFSCLRIKLIWRCTRALSDKVQQVAQIGAGKSFTVALILGGASLDDRVAAVVAAVVFYRVHSAAEQAGDLRIAGFVILMLFTLFFLAVLRRGDKVFSLLEKGLYFLHKKHIIHRDIKPDNFVVGRGSKKKYIYILDFGLAKKYRSSRTLEHYAVVKSKNLVGTARYASINALNGLTQSRRDDLEAIGYVLMYFLRGRLPWQGIPVKNKEERYRKIMEKKIATSAEELCQGFPEEFTNYVNYTRNLQYEQDPDYAFLKNLFVNVLKKEGHVIDCYYDWDKMTIRYFRDFENFKIKKEKSEKNININITTNNKTNENNTLNEGKYIQVNNTNNTNNVLSTMNNMDNTMNTYISNKNIPKVNNSIQNNKKYLLNNKNLSVDNNNNNITSNISLQKNVINAHNYEGSALKVNDIEQINKSIRANKENIDTNNLNVQTNNYLENNNMNNNNVGNNNNNVDNNIQNNNNKTKKIKEEKDNCCCLIF